MTETAPANLQDYILAEVTRKTSEEHIRTLIDKKIDEAIKGAVDDEFRYGGNLKKQMTAAVSRTNCFLGSRASTSTTPALSVLLSVTAPSLPTTIPSPATVRSSASSAAKICR